MSHSHNVSCYVGECQEKRVVQRWRLWHVPSVKVASSLGSRISLFLTIIYINSPCQDL